MHRPTVMLLALGLTAAAPLAAMAENTIAYQSYKYVEKQGRISVVTGDLEINKDFGTDYSLKVDVGHDAISGATPCWRPKLGYANEYASGLCNVSPEVRNSLGGGLTVRDVARNEYTLAAAVSREPDFYSRELSGQAMLWSDELKNRSYIFGASVQANTAIANANTNNTANESSTNLYAQFGVNQILNATSSVEASVYAGQASGYLSNDYLKIVRQDGGGQNVLANDARPDSRRSGGAALRWIAAWPRNMKTQVWARYYADDWGMRSTTLEGKVYWDLNEHWRINPVLRAFTQSSANFYRGYGAAVNTFAATGYGSNDARLGAMKAVTTQLNVEYRPSKEWALNLGVVNYRQNTSLVANWLTAGFVFRY